jgi:4-amino-4-deoxy-L-arabinose transferase-like glycosyltransferase
LNSQKETWYEVATVAGSCLFLLYFGAAAIGLVGADEPRYAQIAREMLERGDWVTPTLYGHHWFEKPILYYWSAMVSYKIFGVSDWAARLPAATFAMGAVFAVWAFLRRFVPGARLDGALMTAGSVALIGFGRGAGPDMLLAACFTVAMLSWMAWYLESHPLLAEGALAKDGAPARVPGKRWLLAFYFFSALGMLAKGPVAPALAGAVVVLYALLRREPRTILRTLWLPGIALFLAVALPWYVLVQVRNAEFFRVFVLEHNVARFATNLYRHKQPFWYYAPVLLAGTLPWTFYWLAGMWDGVRNWRGRAGESPAPTPPMVEIRQFLVAWIVFVAVFFSISQSKLPGYILPALPACTMLTALYVQRKAGERANFTLLALHAAVPAALTAGVLLVPYALVRSANAPRATAGVLAALVFIGVSGTLWRRGLRMLRFVTLAPLMVLLAFLLRGAGPAVDAKTSYREVAAALDRIDNRSSQVAIYKLPRQAGYGLSYYRGKPVLWYDPNYFDQPRGIPEGNHMVVAPLGVEDSLANLTGKRVSKVGEFAPQKLAFYWVSAQSTVHGPQ